MSPLFNRRPARVLHHHRRVRRTTPAVLVLLVQLVGPVLAFVQEYNI